MTAPSGILDFFVLEASEYIEQLDGLVLAGGAGGPNAESFQRAARALRGSATMARLNAFAELAAALERAARALRDGSLRWSPALSGAVVGAVDDLKILVRAARAWGDGESRRASARAAEISGFLPAERNAAPSPGTGQTSPSFLAAETANIAAGLEFLLTRPADPSAPTNVLNRLRALRGVAAIKDIPPLPEVLDAADQGLRPIETQQGELTSAHRELVDAAAAVLRDAARVLRGSAPTAPIAGPLAVSPEASARFEAALGHFADAEAERTQVVPVSNLFFDDNGPHVVSSTAQPPTTPSDRFRLEMVGHGEHLRRLIGDARASSDPAAVERSTRALGRMVTTVRGTAESFGEGAIAQTVAALGESVTALDAPGLAVLTGLADLLSSPGHDSERLRTELPRLLAGRLERDRVTAAETPQHVGGELQWLEPPVPGQASPPPPARPAPGPPSPIGGPVPIFTGSTSTADMRQRSTMPLTAPSSSPPKASPAGAGLASLLELGIASVEELAERPLSAPVPVEETLVPIESLVYRGEAAWRRALELRDDLRKQPTPPRESLEELYDLLDLVTDE
jgi:HPt (histidine-containing phosphotransfer) domain-containing protein